MFGAIFYLDHLAAEEHELVPGFALQAVFAFLRSQHSLYLKVRSSYQSARRSTSTNSSANGTTTSNSSIHKPDSGSRNVRHDRRMNRLQNQKDNINNNSISVLNNNTASASKPAAPGEPRKRGRPRKFG